MRERSGEADFEAFVRASGASLLRTAWLLTGDWGHAEDLLQGALERTARQWGRLNGSPEAYARRTVINAATDSARRRRSRVVEVTPVSWPEPSQDDGTARVDLREALADALRQLPMRQRTVVVCRYVLDLDERQTAQILGVTVGTVKASANRGLAALRLLAPDLALTAAAGIGGQR